MWTARTLRCCCKECQTTAQPPNRVTDCLALNRPVRCKLLLQINRIEPANDQNRRVDKRWRTYVGPTPSAIGRDLPNTSFLRRSCRSNQETGSAWRTGYWRVGGDGNRPRRESVSGHVDRRLTGRF